jgi:hypothetical protein
MQLDFEISRNTLVQKFLTILSLSETSFKNYHVEYYIYEISELLTEKL